MFGQVFHSVAHNRWKTYAAQAAVACAQEETMTKKTLANLMMLIGSMIWGAAFVAQSVGAEYIGAFTFGSIRFFLGTLVLLPMIWFTRKKRVEPDPIPLRKYITSGFICGVALFLGATLQQFGIMHTTVGKSGFVSALYVVLVPIFAFVIYRRRIHKQVVFAILLSIVGVYLLCVNENFSVNLGDALNFVGAIFWAIQILCIEKFSQGLNGLKFAVCEFMTCSILSGIFMVTIERPTAAAISAALLPLLYAGLLSVGVGFTAQIVCLQYTDPVIASLIMSLESVFSVVFGFLLLHEVLTLRQGFGCVLVFGAVILAQLQPKGAHRAAEE